MIEEGNLSSNFLQMEAEITRLTAEVSAANERADAAVADFNDARAENERLKAELANVREWLNQADLERHASMHHHSLMGNSRHE